MGFISIFFSYQHDDPTRFISRFVSNFNEIKIRTPFSHVLLAPQIQARLKLDVSDECLKIHRLSNSQLCN